MESSTQVIKKIRAVIIPTIVSVLVVATLVSATTTISTNIETGGGLIMNGNISGSVTIQPASNTGTWSLTLPTSDGTNGQTLVTDGNGVTSWTTISSGTPSPWQIAGSKIYYNEGNIGIGTSDPQSALDVDGNILVRGELTVGNTILLGPEENPNLLMFNPGGTMNIDVPNGNALAFSGANNYSFSDSVEVNGSISDANGVIRPYKVYTALITQSGTNDPEDIVLENTMGAYEWEYYDVGLYVITFSETSFTQSNLWYYINILPDADPFTLQEQMVGIEPGPYPNSVRLNVGVDNSLLIKVPIEIRVYE
jgi:hypothetical protein